MNSRQPMDEERFKALLKTAMVEVLEEKRELVQEILEDVIEDIALARAIDEGAASRTVDPTEVYKILKGRP